MESVLLGSVALAGMMGSAGIWYSYPAHQEQLQFKVRQMHEKMNVLEEKLGLTPLFDAAKANKQKIKKEVSRLLHKFDKDGDGQISHHDMDVDGDGNIDHHDLSKLLTPDEHPTHWSNSVLGVLATGSIRHAWGFGEAGCRGGGGL